MSQKTAEKDDAGQKGKKEKRSKLYDTLRPFVEEWIQEHGGRFVFNTPIVGTFLVWLRHKLGPKAFAVAMKAGAGILNVPRSWFPDGEGWDLFADALNDLGIDELGISIAQLGAMSDDEFAARVAGVKHQAQSAAVEEEEAIMDPNVIVFASVPLGQPVPNDAWRAGHETCVSIPPRTIRQQGGGGGGRQRGPREVPNPQFSFRPPMPWSDATMQGIASHCNFCHGKFEEAEQKQVDAAQARAAARKAKGANLAELLAELTDDEADQFWGLYDGRSAAEQARIRVAAKTGCLDLVALRHVLEQGDEATQLSVLALYLPEEHHAAAAGARVLQGLRDRDTAAAAAVKQTIDGWAGRLRAYAVAHGRT